MSTMTKAFVVMLSMLSIVFTVMTVSIVAQGKNWRDTAVKYEEVARIADTNLRHEIAANSALLATARDEARDLRKQIGDLRTDLDDAVKTAAKAEAQRVRVEAERSSGEAMNRGLLAQLDLANSAREQYRTQRNNLETSNVDLQQRNIDLNDRVNELTTGVDVLQEQKRQYEQQVNILKKENRKLGRMAGGAVAMPEFESPSGSAVVGVTPRSVVASRSIRGRVSDVDGDLITISVGGADGVQKNMTFTLSRGENYVGELRITLVDPNQSAGRLIRSTSTPLKGDQVVDAASSGRSGG